MNPIRNYYIKEYGSEKGYLFLLMQLSVIAGVLISICAVFLKNNNLIFLELFPAILLIFSLNQFRNNFAEDFRAYAIFFTFFFAISILAPYFLRIIFSSNAPLESIRNLFYIIILFFFFYVFYKYFSRKFVFGKVLMYNKDYVAVQIDYDLLAGIRPGKYVVENIGRKFRKNQKIKISIKGGIIKRPEPFKVVK